MRRLVCVLALALSACWGQTDENTPQPSATPSAVATPTAAASASASASSNGARSVSEETDDFLFEYSYPKEAGRVPALAALLDQRLDKARAGLIAEAAEARKETREDGFPYNKHSATVVWKVVSDLPDWLSLSGEISSYSGGAHGNYGFDSLVWDKRGARAYEAINLFQSAAALDQALGERLCAALNKERGKRRGEPVKKGSEDEFDRCVGIKEATVLVGSRGHRQFDRIGVQFGPYAAGPYAEGSYEFTFPVDRKILAVVKPEFRGAFAARN